MASRMSKQMPLELLLERRMLAPANILAGIPSGISLQERMQASAPLIGCAPTFLARIARNGSNFSFPGQKESCVCLPVTGRACSRVSQPADGCDGEAGFMKVMPPTSFYPLSSGPFAVAFDHVCAGL
jgi:hypothetical protein